MINEENDILIALATSPDFLSSLAEAIDQSADKSISIKDLGFWFFSQGYLSCLEYMEKRYKFHSFKYESKDE